MSNAIQLRSLSNMISNLVRKNALSKTDESILNDFLFKCILLTANSSDNERCETKADDTESIEILATEAWNVVIAALHSNDIWQILEITILLLRDVYLPMEHLTAIGYVKDCIKQMYLHEEPRIRSLVSSLLPPFIKTQRHVSCRTKNFDIRCTIDSKKIQNDNG